jgi:ubiquinone/menaquinone biosynthesis C-methylase UbiE
MGQHFDFEAAKLGGEPSKPHINRLWDIFLTYGCRRILDAGCGFGWFGRYKPEGVEVIGVDINEEKLKIAQTYEKVIKGNICFLPFRDSSFDGVLASHILEHVQDDHRAMKEFYRVLRGGGSSCRGSTNPLVRCNS